MNEATLLLLGHGSRDPAGVAEFLAVADAVQRTLPHLPVEAGVLEFPGPWAPTIAEAFARCAARGTRQVLALPVLLHFGVHGTADVPAQVAAARQRHGRLEIRLAPPLQGHERLLDLVAQRCDAARATLDSAVPSAPTTESQRATVLLVGRGSTSPRANADLYATARLFQESRGYPAVEVCFVSLAPPCVPAGIRRCVALGARRVLVVPYFVNTGVLVRRIHQQVAGARLFYPAVDVAVVPHFGPDSLLVAALLDRAQGAWPELVASPTTAPTASRTPDFTPPILAESRR
jgi:sirohydrochlorin cobaltochelatase